MARKPTGWNDRMLTPNTSIVYSARAVREHRRQQGSDELVGCQIGQDEGLTEALLSDVGRQRARPSGVGRRQGQRRRSGGMPVGQLERQRTTERQPGHVRPSKSEPAMNPARQSA